MATEPDPDYDPPVGNRVGTAAGRAGAIDSLILLVAYAAVAIWWLWPAPELWSTHAGYNTDGFANLLDADFHLNAWILSWGSHAIATNPIQLFDANTFYPAPTALAYSEHMLGHLPLFAPAYWLSSNPILAFNLTAFLTYPLSALFMYVFAANYLSRPAAAFCGFAFAFAPFRAATPPHIQMLGIQYFPLALHAADGVLRTGRWRFVALLATALALQGMTSAYLMYSLPYVWGTYLVLVCASRPYPSRRALALLACGSAVAIAVLALTMLPYLTLRQYGLIPSYDSGRTALGLFPVIVTCLAFLGPPET